MFNFSRWFGRKGKTISSNKSFGVLIGGDRVPLLADWLLVNKIPTGTINIPVTAASGEYKNYREYLDAEYTAIHTITGTKNNFPLRLTFYKNCILLETHPDTDDCEAVLIEPDPAAIKGAGERSGSHPIDNVVNALGQEFVITEMLKIVLEETKISDDPNVSGENELLIEGFNILLWCAKYSA